MLHYIGKRLLQSIIVLLGVTSVVFIVMNLTGDPLDYILPPGTSQEFYEQARIQYGYDQPILAQYVRFLGNALRGDFGMSHFYNEPAMQVVLQRLPATLQLAFAALTLAIIFGIPAGIISAARPNSWIDAVVRSLSILGQCIPVFWLGLMLILLFGATLQWLPTFGNETPLHLILPSVTLAAYTAASIARLLRSSMLDALGQDYITVARARGVHNFSLVTKHAFKNSLSAVLTILGLQLATLMGGSLVTETVFSWPGIGRLLYQAILNRDFMVVEAGVCLVAMFFVLINLLVDISYALINPRIKFE